MKRGYMQVGALSRDGNLLSAPPSTPKGFSPCPPHFLFFPVHLSAFLRLEKRSKEFLQIGNSGEILWSRAQQVKKTTWSKKATKGGSSEAKIYLN